MRHVQNTYIFSKIWRNSIVLFSLRFGRLIFLIIEAKGIIIIKFQTKCKQTYTHNHWLETPPSPTVYVIKYLIESYIHSTVLY